MANINHICDFIIRFCDEGQIPLSNIKLQKLLYYCQAWNLAIYGTPLFDNEFEAWIHGPVCRQIFDRFKETKSLYTAINSEDIVNNDIQITENESRLIKEVMSVYADFDGFQLEELSHQEDPWKLARIKTEPNARCEVVITKESMRIYYSARINDPSKKG